MKARVAAVTTLAVFASTVVWAGGGSWTGYISDSMCGAKGAKESAEECTKKCIQQGAKYVFVNDKDKKVYAIDDQDKVAPHAGHHVVVKGTVQGDTLKLDSIDMASKKSS